jgi:hypothetical protein
MTKDEWLTVEVGDVLIEAASGGRREALSVSRVSGKRGQGGKTRTTVTVPSMRGVGRTTLLINTEDIGGVRWRLERASAARDSVERMLTISNIKYCARCGGDHDKLEARPLAQPFAPSEAVGTTWTHWATCPTNGDPIMVRNDPDPQPPVLVDGMPRRIRVDLQTPAEGAIRAAIAAVEVVGADVLLTQSVQLLGRALDRLSDYVDANLPSPDVL